MSVQLETSEYNAIRDRFLRQCYYESCRSVKPPMAHHCKRCGRCVMRMDHHCPWVSNCIGLKNIKFFLLFNFYVILLTLFNIADYTINLVLHILLGERPLAALVPDRINAILLGTNAILTVIFLLFSFSLFYNQINMLKEQTSKIDVLKGSEEKQKIKDSLEKKIPFIRRNKTTSEKLADVMGDGGVSIWWLFPIYRLTERETRVEIANFS